MKNRVALPHLDPAQRYSIEETIAYLRSSRKTVFDDIREGRLATIREGKDFKSKAKWDGDVLVVNTTQDAATASERYELAPDGFLRLFVERSGHHPVTLYFQRQ